jgi:hypothetical protein
MILRIQKPEPGNIENDCNLTENFEITLAPQQWPSAHPRRSGQIVDHPLVWLLLSYLLVGGDIHCAVHFISSSQAVY